MACLLHTLPRQSGSIVALCINGSSVFSSMAWQDLQTNKAAAGAGGCASRTCYEAFRKSSTIALFDILFLSSSVTTSHLRFSPDSGENSLASNCNPLDTLSLRVVHGY